MYRQWTILLAGAFAVACGVPASASDPIRPEAKDLVSIRVAGTDIDVLPDYVDLICASPEIEAKKLIAAGGEKNEGGIPNAVVFHGILYLFGTVESWQEATDFEFAEGDVIYMYLMESEEARTEFIRRYELTQAADIRARTGHEAPMWRATPGYYVLLPTPVMRFSCSMHTHVVESEAGKCRICGMDLIESPHYQ